MKGTSKRRGCGAAWAAAALLLAAAAGAVAAPQPLPATLNLPKDYKLPGDVSVAVYLPAHARKFRFYLDSAGFWVQPGRSLEQGVRDTLPQFFANAFIAGDGEARGYGLLVALRPGSSSTTARRCSSSPIAPTTRRDSNWPPAETAPARSATSPPVPGNTPPRRVMQQVAAQLVIKLRPDAAASDRAVRRRRPASAHRPQDAGDQRYRLLRQRRRAAADRQSRPASCTVTEVQHDGQVLSGKVCSPPVRCSTSPWSTRRRQPHFLPAPRRRTGAGRPIVNVGFPLQSLLVATPNLTRGNVSARGASGCSASSSSRHRSSPAPAAGPVSTVANCWASPSAR
ncbi:MAG: hypothetical protein U1F25_00055 [Rubrivivax sp.]